MSYEQFPYENERKSNKHSLDVKCFTLKKEFFLYIVTNQVEFYGNKMSEKCVPSDPDVDSY